MTDGISEYTRIQRDYDARDDPICIVCYRKMYAYQLKKHIAKHTIESVMKAIEDWSISLWEQDKKENDKK